MKRIFILLCFLVIILSIILAIVVVYTFNNHLLPPQESQSVSFAQNSSSQSLVESQSKPESSINLAQNTVVFEPDDSYINNLKNANSYELPIEGATGYASVSLNLYSQPDEASEIVITISPGAGFTILSEQENFWQVNSNGTIGFINHTYCFINLPDIIPSIVYDISNAYSSVMKSSYIDIPNITGQKLYSCYNYNNRFGKEEYIVPVLYSMAKKICAAQHNALQDGNTLVIYEAFRPYETQNKIVSELTILSQTNATVLQGITTAPWSIEWYIYEGVSNHQIGYSIDVTLADIETWQTGVCGEYGYVDVISYTEYPMPTEMHELSVAATVLVAPVRSLDSELWKSVELASTMNEYAILLQNYCTKAGLTPIASEWWHFNDLAALESINKNLSDGKYFISHQYSTLPH